MNPMYFVAAAAFVVQIGLCFAVKKRLFAQIPAIVATGVFLYGIVSFSDYMGLGTSSAGTLVSIMAVMTGISLFSGIALAWLVYLGITLIKKMADKKN